jgi:cobalamin-dependent methionine synthase I
MREIQRLTIEETTPTEETVLRAQGIPNAGMADERIVDLAQRAISIYRQLGEPLGIVAYISIADFEHVFRGEGQNDEGAPLGSIYESSNNLALFAVTIGQRLCSEISDLLAAREYPLGSMLDSTCSEGAEMTAEALERHYRDYLTGESDKDASVGFMRFSPGYCGWHISSQKNLFEYLKPGEIGIELNETYLMKPLKSVTGVIVSGRKEIFQFSDAFDFCAECKDHSCQDRIRAMLGADA